MPWVRMNMRRFNSFQNLVTENQSGLRESETSMEEVEEFETTLLKSFK